MLPAPAACFFLALTAVAVAQVPPAKPMLAAGDLHALALRHDGTVHGWGSTWAGQAGAVNASGFLTSPQQFLLLSGVRAVAAGGWHSLALLANGQVVGWGSNVRCQAGAAAGVQQQLTPVGIVGPGVSVAAGYVHSLALLADGTVKGWGWNQHGQLGIGSGWVLQSTTCTPVSIPGLTGVTAIAAAGDNSLALLANGTVMGWGQYHPGNWLSLSPNAPQLIAGLAGVVAVSSGQRHFLALLSNGTVMAWGVNDRGQLGLGHTTSQFVPQIVPGLPSVVAVCAGGEHSLALLFDGTVVAWGANYSGQLGLGNTVDQLSPQPVPGLSGATTLAAGYMHSLALLTDGTSKAWGSNWNGQLGIGSTIDQHTPQSIPGLVLTSAAYDLAVRSVGTTAVGIEIPWNTEVGVLGSGHSYFNVFSFDALNASSPGTGPWFGLHVSQPEVLFWMNAGSTGLAIAAGTLNLAGGATAVLPVPLAQLAGVTVHGKSIAFNQSTLQVVADSNIASHTF